MFALMKNVRLVSFVVSYEWLYRQLFHYGNKWLEHYSSALDQTQQQYGLSSNPLALKAVEQLKELAGQLARQNITIEAYKVASDVVYSTFPQLNVKAYKVILQKQLVTFTDLANMGQVTNQTTLTKTKFPSPSSRTIYLLNEENHHFCVLLPRGRRELVPQLQLPSPSSPPTQPKEQSKKKSSRRK
jgi:hypothetical protein